MEQRQTRQDRPAISAIGLGCMGMSGMYGPVGPRGEHRDDPRRARRRHHAARHRRFLRHGPQRDADRRGAEERAAVAPRFGDPQRQVRRAARPGGRLDRLRRDVPSAVKNFLAYSLQRLGVDYIDIYRPARLDPNVPIEDTVGAIADMVEGRLCPPHRPVRSRRRDDPPRGRRASDRAICRSNIR